MLRLNHVSRRGTLVMLALVVLFGATIFRGGLIPAQAQAGDLFFSEYVEGSSFSKALEIYNGTGSSVDLSNYEIRIFFNGSTSAGATITLSGTLAAGDVYIVADDGASPDILSVADQTSTSNFFNGDDAVALVKNGTLVDVIGQIGVDPGSQWPGGGADDTLVRNATVCAGDTNGSDPFDASVEWTVYGQNTFSFLGSHTVDCGGEPPAEPPQIIITEIMQNPSAVSDANGEYFEIYNAGDSVVDLDGWTFADNDFDSFTVNTSVLVAAGDYAVLANNGDSTTNGGFDADYVYGTGWFLANGADEVVAFDSTGTEIDRVEYDGGPSFPDPNGASMSLCDVTADNNDGSNWTEAVSPFGAGDLGTPGAANDSCDVEPPAPDILKIHEIQGDGFSTPFNNQTVIIEGIVVGDHQDDTGVDGDLNGFFVQEEDADADSNPATSEGIFVFDGSNAPLLDVATGDLVRVEGTASERFGNTQISATSVEIISNGNPLPTAAEIALPLPVGSELEHVEGMRVTLTQTMIVTDLFTYGRFGEVVVTPLGTWTELDGRIPNFTQVNTPDVAGYDAHRAKYDATTIVLDDGFTFQNPDSLPYPPPGLSNGNPLRAGDQLSNITGVLNYDFNLYRVQPTVDGLAAVTYTEANPRPAEAPLVTGNVTVGSFNVLNWFVNGFDNQSTCGPTLTMDCRGADNAEELERQLDKLSVALAELGADVIGLQELENTPDDAAGIALVIAVNDQDIANGGNGGYNIVMTGATGTDAIRTGLLYDADRVMQVGTPAVLDTMAFLDPNNTGQQRNRPATAATFMVIDPASPDFGARFTVVSVHLKSKGSSSLDCAVSPLDCPQGDGQGYWNSTRALAMDALAAWLDSDPTGAGNGETDVFIVGDYNAYFNEDPVTTLANNPNYTVLGTAQDYSYSFDGEWGALDHAAASTTASAQVTGFDVWNINADEALAFDYSRFNFDNNGFSPYYDGTSPIRASDHDPLIVGLDLNIPPTANFGALFPAPFIVTEDVPFVFTSVRNDDTTTFMVDCTSDGTFDYSGADTQTSCAYMSEGTYTVTGRVIDGFGEYNDYTQTVTVLSLVDSIDVFLRGEVEALTTLNRGQERALLNHLDNVLRGLERPNGRPAEAQLMAFIEQVQDFMADGVIAPDEGEALISYALRIYHVIISS